MAPASETGYGQRMAPGSFRDRRGVLITVSHLSALAWLMVDVWRVRQGDTNTLLLSAGVVFVYSLILIFVRPGRSE